MDRGLAEIPLLRPMPQVSLAVEHSWNYTTDEERDNLANHLMTLESEIFHHVLTACWERHFCAVNIHDAVIVLDTDEAQTTAPEDVKNIIEEVYHSYGLFPSCNVEIG